VKESLAISEGYAQPNMISILEFDITSGSELAGLPEPFVQFAAVLDTTAILLCC
jgi:hypothetical protein